MPSHQGRTHQGRKVAVCGKPIAHSLSPVIHAAGFAAAGLFGWSYGAIECAESELPQLVAGLGPEWAGLSLTMPLKEVALAVAADAAPVAIAAGAANTLVRRHDGTWYADNTDIAGIVRVLRDAGLHHAGPSSHGPSTAGPSTAGPASAGPASAGPASAGPASAGPASAGPASAGPASAGPASAGPASAGPASAGPSIAVLGGGGTARAALAAAAQLGATQVTVVTRRPGALDDLTPAAVALGLTLTGVGWADAPGVFTSDAIISTVPKGAADALATRVTWRRGTVLFDAIYDPWPTPLAAAALAHGVRVVSGLDLLLAQALGQFELFTGVSPAPERAMREALTAAASVR